MSETLRVLVHTHPNPADHFEPQRTIWERLKDDPDTHLHPWPKSPYEIGYLDELPQPSEIIVGGQTSWACVLGHLMTLAEHPKIKSGEIGLRLSRSATFGDCLEDIVEDVYTRTGVKIQIVK